MEDIELARHLLEKDGLNLVIVKEGKILRSSRDGGVRPLFEAIVSLEDSLYDATIVDKVVGMPVAMLCLYARIASVYARIMSEGALATLKDNGVIVDSDEVVPHILNYDGSDVCPFEKMAQAVVSPNQLFSLLQSLFTEGRW